MRFMMVIRANQATEAGVMPGEKTIAAMAKFNEDLAKAGVLLGAEGLQPSSKGALVRHSGKKTTVVDGPFTESKELIAGYWMIDVKSKEEAIAWAKRVPFEPDSEFGDDGVIELRPLFEMDDFAPR